MELRFQVQGKIRRPVAEVFDAVVNPGKLSGYFTTAGASAPLATGTTVMWEFADFPGPFPVKVLEVERDRRIVLEWESSEGGYDTRVEMEFEPADGDATLVRISESGWRETPAGVKASYDNCGGWMQMLCSMKAYVEHGINLREGMF